MVGIYIPIKLQPSLPLHRTGVCGLFLHSALHEGLQNSVLFHKTYQNISKTTVILCGSKCSNYAAYLQTMQMCPSAVQEEPSFWRTPH